MPKSSSSCLPSDDGLIIHLIRSNIPARNLFDSESSPLLPKLPLHKPAVGSSQKSLKHRRRRPTSLTAVGTVIRKVRGTRVLIVAIYESIKGPDKEPDRQHALLAGRTSAFPDFFFCSLYTFLDPISHHFLLANTQPSQSSIMAETKRVTESKKGMLYPFQTRASTDRM